MAIQDIIDQATAFKATVDQMIDTDQASADAARVALNGFQANVSAETVASQDLADIIAKLQAMLPPPPVPPVVTQAVTAGNWPTDTSVPTT
jgi:hypothetical protein